MRQKLEMQADRIESVLASHRIPARVWGGTVTPRTVRFQLTTAIGTKVSKVAGLAEELAMALGATAVRIYRNGGVIAVEVPRTDPEPVMLLDLMRKLPPVPPFTGVLGVDEDGVPILVRLNSPDVAHILVVGRTGSGKTVLLRALLFSLAAYNPPHKLQMVLIDPKGRAFGGLKALPHLALPPVGDVDEAADVLERLVDEMVRRDREDITLPRLVVAVDELAELTMSAGKQVVASLERLTQRGREAGVHVIAATQKPTAAVLGSLGKANFPLRLVGAVVSPEEAKVATGLAGTGAEKLEGRGDFLLVNRGEVIRFQGAYVSPREIEKITRGKGKRGAGIAFRTGAARA